MTNALTVTAPEGLPYIDTEREFDAPVDAVFGAHRDPDLFRQWMTGDGFDMELDAHEFVSGGRWRYVHRDGNGEYAFHGMFHTVRENEFAIQTFEFEGMPGHDAQTINLAPSQGGWVEFTLEEEGGYPFVNHAFGDMVKGSLGVLKTPNAPGPTMEH